MATTMIPPSAQSCFDPFRPPVHVSEAGEAFIIEAEVPGYDPADIEVAVKDNVLTFAGEVPAHRNAHGHCCDFFLREIPFAAIDEAHSRWEVKNDTLVITLPRKKEVPPFSLLWQISRHPFRRTT